MRLVSLTECGWDINPSPCVGVVAWRSFHWVSNSLLLQLFCSMSAAFTLNFFRSGINFSKWGSFQLPGLLNFGEFKVKLSCHRVIFCWLASCLTSYSSHGGFTDERIQPSNLHSGRHLTYLNVFYTIYCTIIPLFQSSGLQNCVASQYQPWSQTSKQLCTGKTSRLALTPLMTISCMAVLQVLPEVHIIHLIEQTGGGGGANFLKKTFIDPTLGKFA